MNTYMSFLFAFVISFALAPLVMLLAHNSGAVALPGTRHIHSYPTPKFGGIAIAAGVLFVLPFIFSHALVITYLTASSIMLMLGIYDDIKPTTWRIKFVFTSIATSIFIFSTDIWIKDLGNLFGFGDIHLGSFGIPFTYFAVFGIVNAINLIDGMNGLACGVSSIAFLSFAIFASMIGNETVFYCSLLSLGGTLGLFRYNYPKAKIFIGDSGSLFLGFSLAVQAILLTQGDGQRIKAMVPVLILGFPIFDTIRVLMFRVMSKRHPFLADKTHIHHLMMRSGLRPRHVVKVIWIFSALMSVLSFALFRSSSWLMLLIYIVFVAFLGIYVENLEIIKLNKSRKASL